jgi:hypothetical protein
MKVPLSWLRDYVDSSLPVAGLAERLTLAGLEVSGVQVLGLPAPEGLHLKAEDAGPLLQNIAIEYGTVNQPAVQAEEVYYEYIDEAPATPAIANLNTVYNYMDIALDNIAEFDEDLGGVQNDMQNAAPNTAAYSVLVLDYAGYTAPNISWAGYALTNAEAATANNTLAGDSFALQGIRSLLGDIVGYLQGEANFLAGQIARNNVPANTVTNLQSIQNTLNAAIQRINNYLGSL